LISGHNADSNRDALENVMLPLVENDERVFCARWTTASLAILMFLAICVLAPVTQAAVIGFDKANSSFSESAGSVTIDLQADSVIRGSAVEVNFTVSGTAGNLDHNLVPHKVFILVGDSSA
jgi:hypothetical protein